MPVDESIVEVGGAGTRYVIKPLRLYRTNVKVVVTVADSGGNTGRLRKERLLGPVGDIRRLIQAFSDDAELYPTLNHRFPVMGKSFLNDVPVGNILLAAAAEVRSNRPDTFLDAINECCRMQKASENRILPVSVDYHSHLCAEDEKGEITRGEGKIDASSKRTKIKRVFLDPPSRIFTRAYDALVDADKIVFGPGDLYTSLIPNLLVDGFKEAMKKTKAKIIYVCNLMTKRNETHGFTAFDYARVVCEYSGLDKLDVIICNNKQPSPQVITNYQKEGANPVKIPVRSLSFYANQVIQDAVVEETENGHVRHGLRTAQIIADL